MTTPSHELSLGLLAVLANRTTQCEYGPPLDDALIPYLHVIIARVLRTGRGPAGLVEWVWTQAIDHSSDSDELVDHLAKRLHDHLLPPLQPILETVAK